jgi:2'-5' RNA ligase
MRTGLVLGIPQADELFAAVQKLLSPGVAPAMPAHVTVLFPFRTWEALDGGAKATLADLFSDVEPFELTFARTERFPGVAWLSPEPRSAVDHLTQRVFEAFPDCPPYGGQFDDPTPHLTLAEGDEAQIDRAMTLASARLATPITARITRCSLFGLTQEGWRPQMDFGLGARA